MTRVTPSCSVKEIARAFRPVFQQWGIAKAILLANMKTRSFIASVLREGQVLYESNRS